MAIIRHEIPAATIGNGGYVIFQIDPTKYSGTLTWYFETVVSTAGGSSSSWALRRNGTSTDDATITYTSSETGRKRVSFTPPSSATEYINNVTNGGHTWVNAKIILLQNTTSLTASESHQDIGYYITSSGTGTTPGSLSSMKTWEYLSTDWDGTTTFYAEAGYFIDNSMYGVTVILQEDDGSYGTWTTKATIVSASTATTLTRSRVSFTPTSGRHYRLNLYVNNSMGVGTLAGGRIVVNQTGTITKMREEYGVQQFSGAALQSSIAYWDSSEWSGTTNTYYHYFDTTGSAGGTTKLIDLDNSNATLTGSDVASGTALRGYKSGSVTMPTTGHRISDDNTSSITLSGSRLLVNTTISSTPSFTKTHTTDALKRKATTKTHTTDANKKVSGLTKTHTTDTLKHTTATKTHTTDALKRKTSTKTHTTDANKKVSGLTKTHTTDANKKASSTKTHTTDANIARAFLVTHTTDANTRKQITASHTTDALKRKQSSVSHTTDSSTHISATKTHTTSAFRARKRYWVGGTGSWDDTAHWSATSGGSSGASVPLSTDDVIVDANSFSSDGSFMYIPATYPNGNCRSFDATAAAHTFTIRNATNGSYTGITTSADFVVNDYVTLGQQSTNNKFAFYLGDGTAGTFNIGLGNNVHWLDYSYIQPYDHTVTTFNMVSPIRSSSDGYMALQDVTFNTNNYDIQLSAFDVYSTSVVDFGTSTITTAGFYLYSGNTISISSATVILDHKYSGWGGASGTDIKLYDSSYVIGTLRVSDSLSTAANATVHDVNATNFVLDAAAHANLYTTSFTDLTFTNMTFGQYSYVVVDAGETINVSNFTGPATGVVNFSSGTPGTQYYLVDPTASIKIVDRITINDSNVSGGHWYRGTGWGYSGTDNNTGWENLTKYWVGGTGNWNDPSHWAIVSGGTAGYDQPTSTDTAIFDTLSFTATGQTVTVQDNSEVGTLDMSAATNSPTLTFQDYGSFDIYGDLILASSMTVLVTQYHSMYFYGTGSQILDTKGHNLEADMRMSTTGNYTLASDLVNYSPSGANYTQLDINGQTTMTFDTAGYNMTLPDANFWKLTLNLNSSVITIYNDLNFYDPVTVSSNTATIILTGSQYPSYYADSSHTFQNLTINSTATEAYLFAGLTLAGNVAFDADSTIQVNSGETVTGATFSFNGTSGHPVTITSGTAGTQYTFSQASGVVTGDYLNVTDSNVTGGATWYKGTGFVDGGNNTGWIGVYTASHSTDANKRKQDVTTHTTDSLKRSANSLSHTTDSLKRASVQISHTTDSLLRKEISISHSTDSLLRSENTKTHTTDAYLSPNILTATIDHTTDALLRKSHTLSHSTDSLKRKSTTLTHSTDSIKRSQTAVSHTTDSLKRSLATKTHTTDALVRKTNTTTHTTDAFIRSEVDVSHTTDAFTRGALMVTHSTDSLVRSTKELTHSTDTLTRKERTSSHQTDSLLRSTHAISHTTDTILRKQRNLSHTTDVLVRKTRTISHSTDALLTGSSQVTHRTDSNKRAASLVSHTTDTSKRAAVNVHHTTDSLLREVNYVAHQTDALLREAFELAHSTDSNKRKAAAVSHLTDILKRKENDVSHATDALIRKLFAIEHSTDSFVRRAVFVSHSTDAAIDDAKVLTHTTDTSKVSVLGDKYVLISGEWVRARVLVLHNGTWQYTNVSYFDGVDWISVR